MEFTVRQLCEKIEMPQEMTEQICRAEVSLPYQNLQQELGQLFHRGTWEEGLKTLKNTLGEDPDGIKMLTCMLHSAFRTLSDYQKRGIEEDIYIATMKCFSRFVGEHMTSYGRYGFDRSFWTPRQLASVLFRIDELEYELYEWKGEKAVSVHIPSDARLTVENTDRSLQKAHAFMQKFFPDYAEAPYVCDSWLLSPKLQELLPMDSNIILFQNRFDITDVDPEQPDVIEWVFQNATCPVEELPEKTSLQRNMKAALVKGEKIGIGFGVLKPGQPCYGAL